MNRILRALVAMSDHQIPVRLAEMIEPAKSNYAAHRVVMALLEGTGSLRSIPRIQYHLPFNHNPVQRKAVAALWRELAPTVPWGPARVTAAIGAPAGPAAWQPDRTSEKLLAALVYYTDLSGRLLGSLRAAEPPGPPSGAAGGDVEPGQEGMTGPVDGARLVAATRAWVTQLTRLAGQDANAPHFAERIDQLLAEHRRRTSACRAPLQEASVCLATAGGLLEVLVQEAGPDPRTVELLDRIRQARAAGLAGASNVLAEMRENCYFNLALLSLLPAKGP